jgi:hypothetical protein
MEKQMHECFLVFICLSENAKLLSINDKKTEIMKPAFNTYIKGLFCVRQN